ncbi:hypothetical protein VTH06DRAFT_8608 [Thermothelomyces fergusii]
MPFPLNTAPRAHQGAGHAVRSSEQNKGHEPTRYRRKFRGRGGGFRKKQSRYAGAGGGFVYLLSMLIRSRQSTHRVLPRRARTPRSENQPARGVRAQPVNKKTGTQTGQKKAGSQNRRSVSFSPWAGTVWKHSQRPEPLQLSAAYLSQTERQHATSALPLRPASMSTPNTKESMTPYEECCRAGGLGLV